MSKCQLTVVWVLVAVVVLAACGGPGPPAENSTAEEIAAPSPTPTTSVKSPTPQPASPMSTATPLSTPTLAPTETPTETLPNPAGNPDLDFAQVLFVQASQNNAGRWTFDVTVRHNDQGWDHYADAWQVVDLNGNLLAERVLTHPHDNEQPFTRSQGNIDLPPDLTQVIVRAKCNVHGFGGQEVLLDLTAAEGENFEVSRP